MLFNNIIISLNNCPSSVIISFNNCPSSEIISLNNCPSSVILISLNNCPSRVILISLNNCPSSVILISLNNCPSSVSLISLNNCPSSVILISLNNCPSSVIFGLKQGFNRTRERTKSVCLNSTLTYYNIFIILFKQIEIPEPWGRIYRFYFFQKLISYIKFQVEITDFMCCLFTI